MPYVYYLIFLLAVAVGLFVYDHIWHRRYPNAKDIDKAIFRFKTSTGVFIMLLFATSVWIYPPIDLIDVDPKADPAASISTLVKNQELLIAIAKSTREELNYGLILVCLYLTGVFSFIKKIQTLRELRGRLYGELETHRSSGGRATEEGARPLGRLEMASINCLQL